MSTGSVAAEAGRRRLWERPPAWRPWELGGFAGALVAAALLRFHDFDQAPAFTDNADELDWAWTGLTVFTRGVPYGWSYLRAYGRPDILEANGTSYPLVHPYFDHPPLFSLLVGGWSWLGGARALTDVGAAQVRPVAIVLSLIALVLCHLLGRRLLPVPASLAGTWVLAVAPGAVLFAREVESEALLAVLLTGSLLITARRLAGECGRLELWVLFAMGVAAPLTKVPGLAIPLLCGVLLLAHGIWRAAAGLVVASVLGLALYAAWGAHYDWTLFTAVVAEQGSRRAGVLGGWQLIAAAAGINRSLHDGWLLLGWIGLGALAVGPARGRAEVLAWAVAAYALAILVLGDERVVGQYGWYREAVQPLLSLAAGALAWRALADPAPGRLALLLVLAGATATTAAFGPAGGEWKPDAVVLVLLAAAVLGPAVVAAWRGGPWTWAARGAAGAAFAGLLLGSAWESFNLATTFTRL